MKLSRTVTYGLQAILQLAEANRDEPMPCSELASDGQMPERFLLQILRSLVTHGVLISTRGVEGGYTLARETSEISLLEIIEAIEGPMEPTIPDLAGFDEQWQNKVLDALDVVTRATRKQLRRIRVSELTVQRTV